MGRLIRMRCSNYQLQCRKWWLLNAPCGIPAASEAICKSLCPAASMKVFSGSDIAQATAADGSSYQKLATAFAFRDKVVPDCTCNGRDCPVLRQVHLHPGRSVRWPAARARPLAARRDRAHL